MEQAREALKKLNVFAEMLEFESLRRDQALPACVDEPAVQLCRLRDVAVHASRGQPLQGAGNSDENLAVIEGRFGVEPGGVVVTGAGATGARGKARRAGDRQQ